MEREKRSNQNHSGGVFRKTNEAKEKEERYSSNKHKEEKAKKKAKEDDVSLV